MGRKTAILEIHRLGDRPKGVAAGRLLRIHGAGGLVKTSVNQLVGEVP